MRFSVFLTFTELDPARNELTAGRVPS